MAESSNIYVSNGTCYYNEGNEADSSMLPCGNEYFAHAPCCQANDTCLESNACYNAEYGVTYVTGCTDLFYNASVCPNKYADHNERRYNPPWTGMSYCNGSSNEWVLCQQPDDASTIESPAPCSCPTATSDRTMTLSAASTLSATASLPSAIGLEINYMAGHYPTFPAATTATASDTQQSATVTAVATITAPKPAASTASSAQATSTSQGLGTNTTIGIAVGAAVGGVLLFAALMVLLRRLLHWKQGQQNVDGANTDEGNEKAPAGIPDDLELADTGNEQAARIMVSPRTSVISGGTDGHSTRPWSMGSDVADRTSSLASPVRMGSIWEQQQQQSQQQPDHGHTAGPAELAANPLVELEA